MVLFGSLSLVDLFLTWVLIGHSSGIVYESNPIANLLLTHYGWAGMVLFKVTDVLLVAWIVLLVGMFQPHAARRVLSVACGIVGAVALYSSFLVIQFA
jgi:tryptophan-rich sensory protein